MDKISTGDSIREIDESLAEATSRMESFKASKQAELNDLHKKLAAQEKQRRKHFERLSNDNNDSRAIRSLNSAEENAQTLKAEIGQLRREGTQQLHEMRQEILDLRNHAESKIKQELGEKRDQLERLRHTQIPRQETILEELREQSQNLDAAVLILTSKLSQLNKFNHDTVDLETPF